MGAAAKEVSDSLTRAVYAQYLYIGMEKARDAELCGMWPRLDPDEGHLGIVNRIAQLAMLVLAYEETCAPEVYPGVFEYEIVEEMGGWWYENSRCTDGEFMAELSTRCNKWWGSATL